MKGRKNKKRIGLHNTSQMIGKIKQIDQSELIRESDQILKYSWQNIVLVVSLMVFIMFIGYQFMTKYNTEKEPSAIVSEESVVLDDVLAVETDEVMDVID